jgi:hypothetical protein
VTAWLWLTGLLEVSACAILVFLLHDVHRDLLRHRRDLGELKDRLRLLERRLGRRQLGGDDGRS